MATTGIGRGPATEVTHEASEEQARTSRYPLTPLTVLDGPDTPGRRYQFQTGHCGPTPAGPTS
jgi:hypothetical protein